MKRKPGRPRKVVEAPREAEKPAAPQTKYGVNVALPNTSRQKMEAITNLSKTVLELSKALNGVNTQVTVSHNVISGTQTGIFMGTEQTDDLSDLSIRNNRFAHD